MRSVALSDPDDVRGFDPLRGNAQRGRRCHGVLICSFALESVHAPDRATDTQPLLEWSEALARQFVGQAIRNDCPDRRRRTPGGSEQVEDR